MKITPREYYICDYCGNKKDSTHFKFTDNSGLDNKCYDMCSDKCMSKHKEYLTRLYKNKPESLKYFLLGSVEDHIRDFIQEN